ncbi:MAG: lipopolysaccharide transport periplasmic protein LptA [Gammaproteobacteria bacterium]|nr:lipopolysaccharide transport periplasmic protein LptA [Gammaproteobacteria bacterium]
MKLVKHTQRTVLLLAVALMTPAITFAEKADRSKEIVIDASRNTADQANNVLLLEGAVTLEQGTMRITADKMTVKRDDQEFIFAELVALPGKQITFREKREGFNDFMEGTADRAEFDDKARTIKLFTRARLKTGNDVLTGDYIYYNSDTQVIQADGQAPSAKFRTAGGLGCRNRYPATSQADHPLVRLKLPVDGRRKIAHECFKTIP